MNNMVLERTITAETIICSEVEAVLTKATKIIGATALVLEPILNCDKD